LDDVVSFKVGHALLNLHCLFANKAAQQIDQRAFIDIQMRFFRRLSHFRPHFPFALIIGSFVPLMIFRGLCRASIDAMALAGVDPPTASDRTN
jgi:hypothetical protein